MNFIGDYFALGLVIILCIFFFDSKTSFRYMTAASKLFICCLITTALTAATDLVTGQLLESYKKVLALLADEGSPKAIKRAEENYLMHHVNILFMLQKQEGYERELVHAKKYILENIKQIKRSELSLKEKSKVFCAHMLSARQLKG